MDDRMPSWFHASIGFDFKVFQGIPLCLRKLAIRVEIHPPTFGG